MRSRLSIALIALGITGATVTRAAVEVRSPSGDLVATFAIRDFGEVKSCPCYRVDFKGRPVIAESRLGLDLDSGALSEGLALTGQTTGRHDSTWKPVCGERAEIRDCCNEVVLELKGTKAPNRTLLVTFRAYDEGIAFCYTLPRQPGMESVRIQRETSEFRFLADYATWATYSAQGLYEKVTLSKVKTGCERPLVVQIGDDLYAALAEARLVDYARMKFSPLNGVPHGLEGRLDGEVLSSLPLTTPWRVVMAAESPGRLLENNTIILNLNEPCAIDDTSWIKPGKVIREVSLSTAGGKTCIDFAVKRGLQYVEYDAGWYGLEYDPNSDATTITLDPQRSKGPLDLQEVIRYANERGIGIILYVNHLALERQLDQVLPLYRRWGVKGIKFGFVNVGSQRWTRWLHDAIRKCAEQRFMVDVHDEYRTTGFSRTYPNLMTVEGIRGDEAKPTNEQTLTYAFTRMIAGPADNTVCWNDLRVVQNSTHAYQLAKPVVLFSPWQFLFWYDRPAAIEDTPELEFYNHLPTTWDDTRVIHGRIGEYAVVARRKGELWFVGCMNAQQPHAFDVSLDFLGEGQRYTAHVYTDDPTVPTRTHVRIEQLPVDQGTTLKVSLPARGGEVIRIEPVSGL
ncbi:MAG: glycoside hydrolase family 97 N-terminal domain-containing protein [Phycisphaerales bacterium]